MLLRKVLAAVRRKIKQAHTHDLFQISLNDAKASSPFKPHSHPRHCRFRKEKTCYPRPVRSFRLEKLGFLTASASWANERVSSEKALSFHRPGKRQEAFGPRHIKTMKGGRAAAQQPGWCLEFRTQALYVHTHPAIAKTPGAWGPLWDLGQHPCTAHLGATRQSNKCHKKEAGETQGRAPLRGGIRVQVWSCAPCSARAPRGTKGSAGTLGAWQLPWQNTPSHSEQPGPLAGGYSAMERPRDPGAHTFPQSAQSFRPGRSRALSLPGLRDPWKRGPRDRGSEEEAPPPAARTVSGSQSPSDFPATDLSVRIYVYLFSFLPVLKFRLHAVPLVKRGHPFGHHPPPPPPTNSVHQWGRDGAGGEAATRGRRKGEEPKLPMATEKKRRRKKKRARAQPPRSTRPGFSAGSLPPEAGSDSFPRGQARSFARKPGAAGARALHGGQPRTCAGWGGGRRRLAAPGGAAGGHPQPRGQAVAGRRHPGKATPFLFDLGRWPVVIARDPARAPLGALGAPGGAAVISRASAPPHPCPHWPLLQPSCWQEGPAVAVPPGPGNRSLYPPASPGRNPPPQLSLTRSLPDPWCGRLRRPAGLLSTYSLGRREKELPTWNYVKYKNTPVGLGNFL